MTALPRPILIGMCHLPPLPGSPRSGLSMKQIIDHAVRDALVLRDAGFGGLIVENFGDTPFAARRLEPWTIAAMGVIAAEVKAATHLPLGINALRNDALAALGIAVSSGADFIRVNVLVGVSATDQGFVEGEASNLLRERMRVGRDIGIFADVHVKHAVCLSQPDIALAAEETAYRGQADALIVSGATTGRPADLEELDAVRRAVPDRPLLVGSGATPATIRRILEISSGAIVGSCLKPGGDCSLPVDESMARDFIRSARQ